MSTSLDSLRLTEWTSCGGCVETQFDAFTKKHYDKLLKSLDIDEATLKAAIDIILHLNQNRAVHPKQVQ